MSAQTLDAISHVDHTPKYRYLLVLFILVFAVLFRAGNRPLPMMVLEISAILLLLLCILKPAAEQILPKGLKITLWVLATFPILYLIPIPWELWRSLPGHALYSETLSLLESESSFRAASIYPLKTEIAWLAILPPIAIFIAVLRLSVSQIQTLVYILIGVATFEAMLGLIQYGEGVTSSFRFNNPYSTNGAEGTYANRNHLAGFLEMMLPMCLGLLALSVGHVRTELHYHRSWRSRIASLSGWHMNKTVVYAFVCVIILLGLVFTQSRSGVALAMLAVFLSAVAYSRRLGGTNVFGVIGSFFAVVTAIAIEIGLAPLAQRFTVDPLENLRFVIYSNTIEGIGTFFPIGSGPGTYPFIYPRFQSIAENGFVNHAHNDYLEWLMEGGLIAGLLIIMCLWFYARQWPKVWVKGYWSTFQFIQVGAGIGLLLMLLHSLTDFNLHIPANAIYFAFLAGLFFYPYKGSGYASDKVVTTATQTADEIDYSRTNPLKTKVEPPSVSKEIPQTIKKEINPQDIPNPFDDIDEKKDH